MAVRETRALPAAGAAGDAVGQLRAAVAALEADPPPASPSGIIRIEVPVRQRGDAVEWLHAQGDLRARCFFSARAAAPLPEWPALAIGSGNGSGGGVGGGEQRQRPVSVAGVGSAVFFRGTEPFSLRDWRAIKR